MADAIFTNGDLRVAFTIRDDWGAGFVADVTISNQGAGALEGWQLTFEAPFAITNLWNGEVTRDGGRYVIDNLDWNRTIAAGGEATLGFQADAPAELPASVTLNGITLAADGGDPEPPVLPALTIADAELVEGDAGTSDLRFLVELSEAGAEEVRVAYETVGITATEGEDFTAAAGEVVLAPGETAGEILVPVIGDGEVEPDETLEVRLSDAGGATIADGVATGTILNDDEAAPSRPSLAVAGGTFMPGTPGVPASGFFSTSGNQIVDEAGNAVRIAGVNWFGLETRTFAPHGLHARNYKDMMDQMAELGFNTIRLPFSNELLEPGSTPSGIDFTLNPELEGLSGLEIIDAIVAHAGEAGLRVILDNHRITAGDGAQESGLWFGDGGSEQDWIDDWVALAGRYAGNPTVIGADLFNEPHGEASWGDPANPEPTDWNLAATRAANAIHEVNPDWLVFVEGIGEYQGDNYWWGGQLAGVRDFPIELATPDKLVYAPHAYPNSIFAQPWFSEPDFPDNLPGRWTETWGFIHQEGIAPVMLGEFGSRLEDPKDVAWMEQMFRYLGGDFDGDGASELGAGELGPGWTWWSWNPNSGDTGGILEDDWLTPIQAKLDGLAPLMFDLGAEVVGGTPDRVDFTVTLSEPADLEVGVGFRTEDDTALAGEDYEAASGTLTFAPGTTSQRVSVEILDGGSGSFRLLLENPENALIADGEALGTIGADGGGAEPPADGGEGLLLDLVVRDDWGEGFVADISVTNATDETISDWRFLLEMPNDIVNIWSAEIVEDRGDGYVVGDAGWNEVLPPGGVADLGFQGTGPVDLAQIDLTPIA